MSVSSIIQFETLCQSQVDVSLQVSLRVSK